MTPLLTLTLHTALRAALAAGDTELVCTLDLGRTSTRVVLEAAGWGWDDHRYPYLAKCRAHTIYYWTGEGFAPVARFGNSLYKLVPTLSGPPTFEIDGIKMLPSAQVSPYADAERKVGLVAPQGKRILDTCGGLGYFAAWCVALGASAVLSYEISPEVLWLRRHNPWSPAATPGVRLVAGSIVAGIAELPDASFDAALHDPPRFGLAGELYSQDFYQQLARVLTPKGRLFHYTGRPNALTSGRDVPAEVATRLARAGFSTTFNGDGVLAFKA